MLVLLSSENPVNAVESFEKLGIFYLGRSKADNNLLLYDSKDLVTHAVCVGMTGSGKTGLCITLLEEAAIQSEDPFEKTLHVNDQSSIVNGHAATGTGSAVVSGARRCRL